MPGASGPGDTGSHIYAERAFTGRSPTIERDVLITVRAGQISSVVADAVTVPPTALRLPFALPGLVDPHVHLAFPAGGPLDPSAGTPEHLLEHACAVLEDLVACGVTTVRDLGCPAPLYRELRAVVDAEPSRYPRVVGSGPPITSPGGHLAGMGIEAATPGEASAAVARCLAAGAEVIKVVVTGGRMTPGSPMGRLTLEPAVLSTVVEEAHRSGVPVAAHVHGIGGIEAAVGAGVDTLEHCSWTDAGGRVRRPVRRLLAEMRERGQVVVTAGPLPSALVTRLASPGAPVDAVLDRRTRRQVALWRNARTALAHGVTVAVGTDAMFGSIKGSRDLSARALLLPELAAWSLEEALAAVTASAAVACGLSDGSGFLASGAPADIVGLPADPSKDPGALLAARLVMRRGAFVTSSTPQEVPA